MIIEKTPRNALNIEFLLKVFPKARFIYLYRDPRQSIASLVVAWQLGLQTGRFATYVNLPDWPLTAWCFLLPRGWQSLRDKSLFEICCFQSIKSNQAILKLLIKIDQSNITTIDFFDLIKNTQTNIHNTLAFLFSEKVKHQIEDQLEYSKTTLSKPKLNK